MALSNYLGQSVATLIIFTGVGFGLVGQVSPLQMVGFALAIFIVQLGISRWWLQRFGYGPVEGVLRGITNATRPTWRKKPELTA